MKKLLVIYFSFVLLFLVQTVIFLCVHGSIYFDYGFADWMQILWHSLPHDLTLAGYIIALPLVLKLVHYWLPGEWYRKFLVPYICLMSSIVLVVWVVDVVLFSFWKFRLDSTPLIYILDNPAEALSQSPWWSYILLVAAIGGWVWLVARCLNKLYPPKPASYSHLWREAAANRPLPLSKRIANTCGGLLMAGLCFLAIRGGWTESTMNIGRAYFSTEQMLNQGAVNPVFSFFYSISKNEDYAKMYRFMSPEECEAALSDLEASTRYDLLADSTTTQRLQLLKTDRPNILLIILEGFSGRALSALYPDADPQVMPCLSKLYSEGIGWTRFYCTSWRTDRGVASVLASYPAQPKSTVMKDQSKCNHLQYLPLRLKESGYDMQFVYGGDANFTNMQGFLRSGGYDKVVSMADFPASDKKQEWGVPDALMYDYLLSQLEQAEAPYFKTLLTLSSHEPFDVPDFHRLEHPFANSYAYADSCLGHFIDQLRARPAIWDNLLVVILPDHGTAYPDMELQEPDRYHVPMVWVGGALRTDTLADGLPASPRLVDVLGGQVDLSATLFGQLGIEHDDFNFSKDLLDPASSHYAFFDFPDGFGMIADQPDSAGLHTYVYVQDNQQDGVGLKGTDDPAGKAQYWGKAYLQHLFDDLSAR